MTESYTYTKIALLPNGYHKRTRNSTFVQNTTVFDAPFHIVLCIMADDEALKKNKLESIQCANIQRFIESYFKNGVTQTTLLLRTSALEMCFKIKVIEGMKTINCEPSDIKSIMEFYIKHIFTSAKQMLSKCKKCKIRSATDITLVPMDDDSWNKFQNSQNIDFSKDSICSKCNSNIKTTFNLNKLLFFAIDRNVMWQDVAKMNTFQGRHYELSGIIEKRHSFYIAHVLRPNKKWYTFDHTEKDVKQSNFKNQMNIHLLCFREISFYDEFLFQHVLHNTHTQNYHNEIIKISNACAPNTVLHCLACLYIDSPELFEHNSADSDIMNFLTAYASRKIDLMYEFRCKILEQHFTKQKSCNEFRMDCFTNIKGILDKIVETDFPSMTTLCTCSTTIQQHYSVVELDYQELTRSGIKELEKCIVYPRRICVHCQSNITNKSLSNILFFDVQPLVVAAESINVEVKEISVEEITQILHLNGAQYTLKGIIEYQAPIHYTVNCLRSNNKWYNFDDLRQSIIEIPCTVSPHILIYTKNI